MRFYASSISFLGAKSTGVICPEAYGWTVR